MDHLIRIINEMKTEMPTNAVLATIINVEGSAYFKEGTCMLITDKKKIGMLSVGCIEEDLQHRASALINDQRDSQILIYDTSAEHDFGWGRGAGCNGKIHVLLERLHTTLYKYLLHVGQLVEKGHTVTIIKSLQQHHKWCIYISDNGSIFGDESKYKDVAKQLLVSHDSTAGNASSYLKGEHFFQLVKPVPRLFLFGAGMDVKPLVTIARQTGMEIHVWDWRQAMLAQLKPFGVNLENISIRAFVAKFSYQAQDAIIVMTHDFLKDKEIMTHLIAQKPPSYIGIMGPKKRTARLLAGNDMRYLPNLDAPIGADIGASGPVEIAVSIMANVIKHFRSTIIQNERRDSDRQTDHWHIPGSG